MTLEDLTPQQIVAALDSHIIGQARAKKAVAIALRNRIRRQKLAEDLQDEIAPKNIIMIGPTGVGKTEIARRLAKLTGAPFIKVEATKYTEVGYVGRDVESMIRDLMSVALAMVKQELREGVRERAAERAEEVILDSLLPGTDDETKRAEDPSVSTHTRERFRTMLREGKLEEKEIEVTVTGGKLPSIEILSNSGAEELDVNFGSLSSLLGQRSRKRKMSVRQARDHVLQEELDKLIDDDRAAELARDRVENTGIVFIDEIDKIATRNGRAATGDVSREGVQRDILPIVEGSKVTTKHGVIDTSHVLFIAAGAFHISKPSDLIPELQGRFPLRVELEPLTQEDFYRILTQPKNALVRQYSELLATEGVTLDFKDEAIVELARIAAEVNARSENIGARRLHTVMELLLEEVSFTAPDLSGQTIPITKRYVADRLEDVVKDQDLTRFIL